MQVDEDGAIWFRQSWIDTGDICLERGRRALVNPELNEATNDLALTGTAVHAAIELALTDPFASPNDIRDFAFERAVALCDEVPVRWTKFTLPQQLGEHARRCADAWCIEIAPNVEPGGVCESEFKVVLGTFNDRTFGIKGTVDYIEPSRRRLIDWKTASRKWQQKEKQRTAIQPTVYAVAATHGGFGEPFEWPVRFTFGVMVRGNDKATTQLVDVQRVHAHEGWLMDKIDSYLRLAFALGVKEPWPRNESSYLCNEQWCPWWSLCKGARLSHDQDHWSS